MEFGARDWLTIIGFGVALFVQSFTFWRWQVAEFRKRDDELANSTRDRNVQFTAIRAETGAAREQSRNDIARVDKDIASMRNEFSIKLAMIPTRDAMEQMLSNRVGPMEADLRALVIELARLGVHQPAARHQFLQQGQGQG
jgi:uncharacterized protein (DUF1684 family)